MSANVKACKTLVTACQYWEEPGHYVRTTDRHSNLFQPTLPTKKPSHTPAQVLFSDQQPLAVQLKLKMIKKTASFTHATNVGPGPLAKLIYIYKASGPLDEIGILHDHNYFSWFPHVRLNLDLNYNDKDYSLAKYIQCTCIIRLAQVLNCKTLASHREVLCYFTGVMVYTTTASVFTLFTACSMLPSILLSM